jgi:cell division protein FtsB
MSDRKLHIAFPSSQIVLVLMGILILYLAVDFGWQVIVSQQRRNDLRDVQAQIDGSRQRQAELKKQLEYSQSNAAAEAWARDQGWVKANEVPVVIVAPAGDSGSATQGGEAGSSASDSILDQWWDLFFGNR